MMVLHIKCSEKNFNIEVKAKHVFIEKKRKVRFFPTMIEREAGT